MGLTMNGLLFLMIVLFVVLALITPRKTSISMFNQSIDRYNAFVSEYNDVIMELQLIQQEIFNKRYKEEDITEIKKKYKQIQFFTGNISDLIGNMKKGLESKKIGTFKKLYAEAMENYDSLVKAKDTLEALRKRGISEEDYIKEKQWEEKQQKQQDELIIKENSVLTFFTGCNTLESVEKRYRSLCKIYHPDVPSGDESTFKEVQREYHQLQRKMKEGGF